MSTTYVQDSAPDEDGKHWWHAIAYFFDLAAPQQEYATACGLTVKPKVLHFPAPGHDHMTFADWDARFGEDLDLCMCAITDPAEGQRAWGMVGENAFRAN